MRLISAAPGFELGFCFAVMPCSVCDATEDEHRRSRSDQVNSHSYNEMRLRGISLCSLVVVADQVLNTGDVHGDPCLYSL
jgi:hypothetical protein